MISSINNQDLLVRDEIIKESTSKPVKEKVDNQGQVKNINKVNELNKNPNSESQKMGQERNLPEEKLTVDEENQLKEQLEALNKKMLMMDRKALFKLDKKIDKSYISVVNKETDEVIKEFPPKEIRSFMAKIQDVAATGDSDSGEIKNLLVDLEI